MSKNNNKKEIEKRVVHCNPRVRIQHIDWNAQCALELASEKGFRITQAGITDSDTIPKPYSIHSSKFYGTDWGLVGEDEDVFADRYKCSCGHLMGKKFNGITCKYCNTTVEFVDIDMEMTGWIMFDHYAIIQSEFYKMLNNFIGSKVFPSIIKFKEPHEREATKANPYRGIGLVEFRDNFQEIMDYYLKKNRKFDMYNHIMVQKDKIFTSCIPVFSTHLRPFMVKGDDIKNTKDDELYKKVFSNSELLNDDFKLAKRKEKAVKRKKDVFYLRKENILYAIQQDVNSLWDICFNNLDKKNGLITSGIISGRCNFTARNVIIPDPNLRDDQVKLSYTTFLELYKLELISLMVKVYSITYIDAWDIWEKASISYSEEIYKLMQYMVSKQDLIILLNRNPTINYGSQVALMVVDVIGDIKDAVCRTPLGILPVLNADFDGDILNIRSAKISEIGEHMFRNLNPRWNMFISKNDGLLNPDFVIYKDSLIGLYVFSNL